MEKIVFDKLSDVSGMAFGTVELQDDERAFSLEWNAEVVSFFQSLPESTQTDALLFLVRYSKTSIEDLNFLALYYVPAWSIVYWILKSVQSRPYGIDLEHARMAHYLAMLLHALDDHLNDGQLPTDHLMLLLRSHAWYIMKRALDHLTAGIEGGREIVEGLVDDYYSAIRADDGTRSLHDYCALFRKQMATWLIVPLLLIKKFFADEGLANAVQQAYGSFGIAWRLLDDIQDLKTDMMKGARSAVYCCLSEEIKPLWGGHQGEEKNHRGETDIVLNHIVEERIIDRIRRKICEELDSAAGIADAHDMPGLANEFRSLLLPFPTHGSPP